MIIRTLNQLTLAISTILLVGTQATLVHAADSDYSGIAAPPKFTPGTSSYPAPPPGGWEGVVDSIDKRIESDIKATEGSHPAGAAPVASGGTQFPEFQDPPEWTQRDMPQPPEWGSGRMPQPAAGPAETAPQTPEWARGGASKSGGWGAAPPEWGGGSMPEPPDWGERSIPEPPDWGSDFPEPPAFGEVPPAPEPPAWAGRNIPDPPDWGRSMPSYPPPRYNYNRGPGYRSPWDRGRSSGFKGPRSSGRKSRDRDFPPFGSSGPGFKSPWDSGRGGRSMPWGGGKRGRDGWMDKDWFADSWDDMLNAPADMGEMPGGWYAPTVDMPNPVDVGDEFDRAARDVPDQMHNVYEDNRRSNTNNRYDRYDRYRR